MRFRFFIQFGLLLLLSNTAISQVVPLSNGFAHNDYLHKHPLFEALDNGFTNVEADIFLHHNKLVIAHYFPYFKNNRTLETLYLKPLNDYINSHNGSVYNNYDKPIILMIDVKSSANVTYQALKPLLEKYSSILSVCQDSVFTPGKVTVVLSGHIPYELIKNEKRHLAFIDDNFKTIAANSSNNKLFVMASCKYSKLIKWKGNGDMPVRQRNKLCNLVTAAHLQGLKVRLWASPENPSVWGQLMGCGVDFINTDKLAVLKGYLLKSTASLTFNSTKDKLQQSL